MQNLKTFTLDFPTLSRPLVALAFVKGYRLKGTSNQSELALEDPAAAGR
jgi:hypothetical protein